MAARVPPSPRPFPVRGAGIAALAGLCAVAALPACSTAHYEAQANRDAYAALAARRGQVPETAGSLDVDEAEALAGPARAVTEVRLDLAEALRLATLASRDVRARREDVYLKALDYTGVRQRYAARPTLAAAPTLSRSDGSKASAAANPEATLSKRLEAGGTWVLGLVTEFLANFGDPVAMARTVLSADLTLPLVRGSGLAAREELTQAERDVLYEMRSYARFQQEFNARISSAFYRVAQDRQTLENEDLTVRSLEILHARAESFGPKGAGRLADFQVDQTRQDMLRAQDRRVRARQSFEASLDGFLIQLGLPVTTRVVIAEGVLEDLAEAGLAPTDMDLGAAIATAMDRRLDLRNARDERDDADRKVLVAANGLGPKVDLTLGADLTGPDRRPFSGKDAKPTGRVGFGLDLPLERTDERNAYRSAQIQALRAKRAVEGLEDAITADVRQAWRTLEQAKQSFALQREGVALALRRVESANLNLQAGKAATRDVLDAENSLIEARNAETAALVDYVVARIEFERDAGVLRP